MYVYVVVQFHSLLMEVKPLVKILMQRKHDLTIARSHCYHLATQVLGLKRRLRDVELVPSESHVSRIDFL